MKREIEKNAALAPISDSSADGRLSLLVTRIDDKTAVEAVNERQWRMAA